MAQEPYRRRSGFRRPAEEPKEEPKSALRVAGDVVRAVAERGRGIGALISRLGSGALSNMGGPAGAAISGGGEALAQKIEGTGDDGLNYGRIGVEAGIGAVPFGKLIKAGKFGISALKGAGLSGAGVVGRKAADVATGEDPDALKKWSKWDALPVVLGGGMSGALGKFSKATTTKADETPFGPETMKDFLSKKKWNADRIGTEAAKMDAGGYKDTAHGLRVASVETNTGNEKIYSDVARANDRATKQKQLTAKQAAAAEEAAAKIKAKENADAKKIQDTEAAARRTEELKAGLEPQAPTVRESSSKVEGGVRTTASQSFKAPKPDVEEGGEALPAAAKPRKPSAPTVPKGPSIAPKPGVFQLVQDGRVIAELEDEADVLSMITAAGPANRITVVKPTNAAQGAVPAKGEAPFNPPRLKTPPVKEESSPLMKEMADKHVDDMAKVRGTPEDIPNNPVAQALEAERKAALEESLRASGEALPEAGPKLSAPLAMRVAQESEAPEGGVFARFFRDKGKAELAQDYSNKLPDDVQRLFLPILAKYEAAPKKSPQARDFGELLSKMRGELGLPTRPTMPKAGVRVGGGKIQEPPKVPVTPKAPVVKAVDEARPQTEPPNKFDLGSTTDDEAELALREYGLQQNLNKLPNEATDARQGIESELNTILKGRLQASDAAKAEVEPIAKKFSDESGQISPELANALFMRAAPVVAGAGAGAAYDDENRLRGAMLGGAAGLYGPMAMKGLSNLKNRSVDPGDAPPAIDRLVNWQRFSLLSNPYNLGINIMAPTGGGVMGSLEQLLTGAVERTGISPVTDAAELGTKGLKATLHGKRLARVNEDMRDAKELIKTSERADMEGGRGTPRAIDKMMALPADMMTAGDVSVRKSLMNDADWSEDMARKVTVTSNPRYAWGAGLVNLAKSSPVWRLLLPFSRTAVNVAEGSAERIPLVGFIMHYAQKNPELQESMAQQIAEQGLGAAVGYGAYILGSNTTPEEARAWKANAIITNMSGQYGAIAGAAFAAGLAANQGKDALDAGAGSLMSALPLPTTEVAQEMVQAGKNYAKGEPPNPNAQFLPQQWLPDNLTPRILKDDILEGVPGAQSILGQPRRSVFRRPPD